MWWPCVRLFLRNRTLNLCDQLNHHNSPEHQGRACADSVAPDNKHSPKVRYVACISPRFSTVIHVWRSTAKIIAVLMSHWQPCRETLMLRHAWLREREERKRERAEGGRKRGGGGRPGQKEETEKKENMCMTLPPDHVAGVRRPGAKTSTGEEEAPRPATRKEGGGRGEGEREERKKKTGTRKEATPAKKPAAFSAPKPSQNTIPQQECPAPKIVPLYAEVLPTKLCTQTSLRREELKKARLTKRELSAAGFFEQKCRLFHIEIPDNAR